MRTGVAVAAALSGVLLAVALAAGQSQPLAPPDAAGHTQRTDLADAGQVAGSKRVLRFVQVSDAHILDDDAPYPLRQEPLDPYIEAFSASAQRPQDEYTDEVLESIVRAINEQHRVDPFQFVINTGDNIDNDLENELMRFLDLYEGTSTTAGPVSGLPCVPDGQSTDVEDASRDVVDRCTSLPESLLAPRTALAPGLPWYSAFGNHDTLIQGNVNPNPQFDDVAAQHGRRLLTQPEYVAMHFPTLDACGGGAPGDDFGHGYGLAGARLCDDDPDNDGYYSFGLRGVHVIVLDTINDDFVTANENLQGLFNPQSLAGADVIGGYAEGAVDPAQLEWLRAEVAANQDKLIVLFSHHTVNSMFTNLGSASCAPGVGCLSDLLHEGGYATGEQLTAELSAQPHVVAWVGGHTHRNRIEPKGAEAHGFWNIESSSLIDYPQQARIIELWVTAQGDKGFWLLQNFTHDVELSRQLERTDPQRVPEAIGAAGDQDTILWFDVPAEVALMPQPPRARLQPHAMSVSSQGNVTVTVWFTSDLPFDVSNLSVSLGVRRVGPVPSAEVELLPEGTPLQGMDGRFTTTFVDHEFRTLVGLLNATGPDVMPLSTVVDLTPNVDLDYPLNDIVCFKGRPNPPCGNGVPALPFVALVGLALALAFRRR